MSSMPKINKATGKPWTLDEYNKRRREIRRRHYRQPEFQANYKKEIKISDIDEGYEPYPIANGEDRMTFNLGNGARRIVPHYHH